MNLVTNMKYASREARFLFISLFCVWFAIVPAPLWFSTLDNSDLTAPAPCFEEGDQEDLLPSPKKSPLATPITDHLYLTGCYLAQIALSSFQYPCLSSTRPSLSLRC